jgi:hypothetical protein
MAQYGGGWGSSEMGFSASSSLLALLDLQRVARITLLTPLIVWAIKFVNSAWPRQTALRQTYFFRTDATQATRSAGRLRRQASAKGLVSGLYNERLFN